MSKVKFYQCIKQVHAEPMSYAQFMLEVKGIESATTDPQPGYRVIYSKGEPEEYHSWSPKAVFEDGYFEIPEGTAPPGSQGRQLS